MLRNEASVIHAVNLNADRCFAVAQNDKKYIAMGFKLIAMVLGEKNKIIISLRQYMKYLRWLLFPFSLLYGLVVVIRNWCYDAGIFKSYSADVRVISVGNLDVGGAGKSPMTEYLIRLFKDDHKLATLSRGYGRATKGFIVKESRVESQESGKRSSVPTADSPLTIARQIGDEPGQFVQKFPDITVAVCEARVEGVTQLQSEHDLIILDDAYQHRALKPGLSILLFDYNRVNEPHLLLPAGNLREPFSGRKRADVIIISKCPEILSADEQAAIIKRIRPFEYQQVFFTSIAYQPLHNLEDKAADVTIKPDTTVFLLTGIANANPLIRYIEKSTSHIIHHNYPDHHRFSLKNISKLAGEFSACTSKNKLIITTEKDAQRLVEHELLPLVKQLPVLVIPIGVNFLNGTQQQFNNFVINYVR
ncbi:tetraacyldisaccharide 4'-kinase [Mucilaginibacter sp. X5P1]|uniref:tetraacyldisaccharide 4'-kinase n=1 Tax=Mucilaginibacter sp. X5P1 TaxID=2723088 RepID=UPI00185CFEE3|nr:tetraacyldisaccharide 4'-kinase [Mucilaginibacter sp. X5P1]MBB6141898.1 tetraacyldisaccharide 4'-kinase [Mucilaginibacter sp. X5P1]